jgi:hypothetical protein
MHLDLSWAPADEELLRRTCVRFGSSFFGRTGSGKTSSSGGALASGIGIAVAAALGAMVVFQPVIVK